MLVEICSGLDGIASTAPAALKTIRGRLAARMYFPPEYFKTRFVNDSPVDEWPKKFAIVTGYATTGQKWSDAVNQAADQKLKEEIAASGRWHCRVTGYSPETSHCEPGWAVEMPVREACDLGLRYHQDAIYYIESDVLFVVRCGPRDRQLTRVALSFRERLG